MMMDPGLSSLENPAAEAQAAELLRSVQGRIKEMKEIMISFPSKVDPDTFYNQIRPYLSGWMNNPTLPNGVIYEVGRYIDSVAARISQ